MGQLVLVTTSMCSIMDRPLHKVSISMMRPLMSTSCRPHPSRQTILHLSTLPCLEDHPHYESRHSNNAMGRRPRGGEDTLHNYSQLNRWHRRNLSRKSQHQFQVKTGQDCLWINSCPQWLGRVLSRHRAVFQTPLFTWLTSLPTNRTHSLGR